MGLPEQIVGIDKCPRGRLIFRRYLVRMRPASQISPSADQAPLTPEVSVVIPCLNEADTLESCILKAQAALAEDRVQGEIIVADNGSTDESRSIAARLGVR